jgi:hypothetical protein
MNLTKKIVTVIAILCLICSSVLAGVVIQASKGTNVGAARFFDVSVDPSNASLTVGQVQTFTVHCSLPSEGLNYSWSYFTPVNISVSVNGVQSWWNGSGVFDAGSSFSFSFLSACAGLRLSVHVVEDDPSSPLYGGCGDASTSVFDPYSSPSVYLDAFPIGVVVESDGSGWYRYTTNGKHMFSSTNASAVFSNVYGNGSSLVHVVSGTYTLSNWISPCENSTTEGEGWSTILKLGPNANTNMIRFTGVDANNIVIRNLALDGDKGAQYTGGSGPPSWRDLASGIYSGNYSGYQVGTITNNLQLCNLYIHDIYCGAAIRLVMSNNIIISDCKFENCGASSTYMSDAVFVGNSTNVKITNLEATNCLDTAIALCNVQHSTVVGTNVINCGAGIAIVNEYPSTGVNASLLCNYNTIIGGFIQNCSWGNVGVNVNSYTAPPELPDHTTIMGIHLLNNTYNVLNLGEHTILTGCTLGMSAPIIIGTKNVWIRGGTMSIIGNTINDADVGIETVYTTYQLKVSGNTFNPATLTHILNLTGSVTDLSIHGNNGLVYPSDQIGTASFSISTDGTYYYATNCTSGQVLIQNTNQTLVEQYAIGNTTEGTVFLKNMAHNYSLTIPQGVSVRDSVNGSERVFGNVADSSGSPYTISVDNMVAGYYLAQDSSMKYMNGWLSTNASAVINNAAGNTTNGKVLLRGIFLLDSPITKVIDGWNTFTLEGENMGTMLISTASSVINFTGATNPEGIGEVKNLHIVMNDTNTNYKVAVQLHNLQKAFISNVYLRSDYVGSSGSNPPPIGSIGVKVDNDAGGAGNGMSQIHCEVSGFEVGVEVAKDHIVLNDISVNLANTAGFNISRINLQQVNLINCHTNAIGGWSIWSGTQENGFYVTNFLCEETPPVGFNNYTGFFRYDSASGSAAVVIDGVQFTSMADSSALLARLPLFTLIEGGGTVYTLGTVCRGISIRFECSPCLTYIEDDNTSPNERLIFAIPHDGLFRRYVDGYITNLWDGNQTNPITLNSTSDCYNAQMVCKIPSGTVFSVGKNNCTFVNGQLSGYRIIKITARFSNGNDAGNCTISSIAYDNGAVVQNQGVIYVYNQGVLSYTTIVDIIINVEICLS